MKKRMKREAVRLALHKASSMVSWFNDDSITTDMMYDFFHNRAGLDPSETMTIIAALIQSGAKFQGVI